MYQATKFEVTWFIKNHSLFVDEHYFSMDVFIQEALIEENTASGCIRTVAATCGCKILQLCKYEANEYGYEAN